MTHLCFQSTIHIEFLMLLLIVVVVCLFVSKNFLVLLVLLKLFTCMKCPLCVSVTPSEPFSLIAAFTS